MQDSREERKLHPAMVEGDHDFGTVSDRIGDLTLKKRTPFHWFIGFGIAFLVAQLLMVTIIYLVTKGIGIWGTNQPVGWAFPIINFVWWIGIGHAGTLISAILLLLNQKWRTSINRFAEAMTLFAVACGAVSGVPHGPSVARLLVVPVSEHDGHLAAIPQSFDVGRLRGLDLCDGFAAVLVRRAYSRPCDPA